MESLKALPDDETHLAMQTARLPNLFALGLALLAGMALQAACGDGNSSPRNVASPPSNGATFGLLTMACA